jgi:hypothetical protein
MFTCTRQRSDGSQARIDQSQFIGPYCHGNRMYVLVTHISNQRMKGKGNNEILYVFEFIELISHKSTI